MAITSRSKQWDNGMQAAPLDDKVDSQHVSQTSFAPQAFSGQQGSHPHSPLAGNEPEAQLTKPYGQWEATPEISQPISLYCHNRFCFATC